MQCQRRVLPQRARERAYGGVGLHLEGGRARQIERLQSEVVGGYASDLLQSALGKQRAASDGVLLWTPDLHCIGAAGVLGRFLLARERERARLLLDCAARYAGTP